MNKQQKSELIDVLRGQLASSQASFVVNYQGLTVNEMQVLRRTLREKGAHLKIAKGRLVKRAVDGLEGVSKLAPYLKDQIGVVFVSDETSAVAKVLNDFAQKHQALVLKVACFESKVVDATQIKRLANLPSREVLLAQLCFTLKAPVMQFTRVLETNITRLAHVLEQVVEHKKSE